MGPSARCDCRQERPPLGGSHQLQQRNAKPLYDNLPQPRCLPIRTLGRNRPTFDHLLPFGTVGYLRRLKPEHKLASRGAQCIILGIDTNYPRRTFRVRDLTTGQVIMRQAMIWHPTADAREEVSRNTMTRGGGGRDTGVTCHHPRKPASTRSYWGAGRPSRSSRNRNSMSRGGDGPEDAFALERVEHEGGEVLSRRGQLRRSSNRKSVCARAGSG